MYSDDRYQSLAKSLAKHTRHYENVPFEVPESWEWIQIKDVCEVARGGSPRPIKDYLTNDPSGVNWIKIGDTTKDGKYIDSAKEKIKLEGVRKSRIVHKGDFLLTNSMSFGRPYILRIDGCIHDGWLVISPMSNSYQSDFLYYLLSSIFAYEQFSEVASGGVVTNLNSDKVADSFFPLPPYKEQIRIVEEIEKWFALIDTLESAKEDLRTSISQAKSKILDLAIHGKLVPQDLNDEPSIELLKRLNPKFTPCDNAHYENVPSSWIKVPLGNICTLNEGEPITDKEYLYIDVKGLRTGNFASKQSGKYVPVGTTLILVDGENSGEVFYTPVEGYQGSTMKVLNIDSNMNTQYVLYFVNLHQRALRENKVGSAIPHLNKKMFRELIIPIPPISEQERIVEAILQYYRLLDNISANL